MPETVSRVRRILLVALVILAASGCDQPPGEAKIGTESLHSQDDLLVGYGLLNDTLSDLSKLGRLNLLSGDEEEAAAKSVLRAAAMTYVAGAASAAGYIFYLVLLGGQLLFRKRPPAPGV